MTNHINAQRDHSFVGDLKLSELNSDDIIIALIGKTGAGKTNFIGKATGKDALDTGDFDSGTKEIEASALRVTTVPRRIVLLDTPGFCDEKTPDALILNSLKQCLRSGTRNALKLSGVVYCHPITEPRMSRSHVTNLGMLRAMCYNFVPLILTTTGWDNPQDKPDRFKNRQRDLCKKYWEDIVGWGAGTASFDNTPESAWKIIQQILKALETKPPAAKEHQFLTVWDGELQDNTPLRKTTAGKRAHEELIHRAEEINETVEELQQQLHDARNGGDSAAVRMRVRGLQEDLEQVQRGTEVIRTNAMDNLLSMGRRFTRRR